MNGHGIEQDMSGRYEPIPEEEWGDWLEATYDPDTVWATAGVIRGADNPPWDTLDEQNGHA
jgi:hypothetical protein